MAKNANGKKLDRTTFHTSRLLDFCSRKELIAQTGHQPSAWPLVVLKELVDNAVDACENAGIAPKVEVKVTDDTIAVADNGPGIPPETIDGVLDFSVRASSREAYVSPTRGAQGNALKTIVAIPYVLDGESGRVDITAKGIRHEITLRVDRVRQTPVIDHQTHRERVKKGTTVTLHWPDSACSIEADEDDDFYNSDSDVSDSACSILPGARGRFLQIAEDYAFLNPHLHLDVDWFGERTAYKPTDPRWPKWLPSDPTSPHWYRREHLERLITAYVAHDLDSNRQRTVREFVSEFRGLTATAKQKRVLEATGLSRENLSYLANGQGVQTEIISRLHEAMVAHSKPVKPAQFGVIGKEHIAARFEALGCEMGSFRYKKVLGHQDDGLPYVIETAFAWRPDGERKIVTGVNWSPGILNPFRELGSFGESLDSVLSEQYVRRAEPIAFLLHAACPRVEYADRGKSAVVLAT